MKAVIDFLLTGPFFQSRHRVESEVDEQLSFHLESLTQELLAKKMTLAEARQAAAKRLGNIEQIRNECVAIRRRSRPTIVALRASLIVMVLGGIVVRTLDAGVNVHRIGDLLIVIPILSGILLYVRGLKPSSFLSKAVPASPLGLSDVPRPLFTVYDQRMLTPVERLISDK